MIQADVAAFEELATKAYSPQVDTTTRNQATQILAALSDDASSFTQCVAILSHSQNHSALMLAINVITSLLTNQWNKFSPELVLQVRNQLLSLLFNSSNGVPQFIQASAIRLLCRITKIGFIRDDRHRSFPHEVIFQLDSSPSAALLGLQLLSELVEEMDSRDGKGQTLDELNNTIQEFKTHYVLYFFKTALATAEQLHSASGNTMESNIRAQALELARKCICFKWYGLSVDETREYLSSIRIPDNWKETLENPATLELLFNLLPIVETPSVNSILEILVQIAACRQSLFGESDLRNLLLSRLLLGSSHIISQHQKVLKDEEAYIQFCRYLLALKSTYRIDQLGILEGYEQWIHSVVSFTRFCFEHWRQVGKATHYLLSLWAQFTYSLGYARPEFLTSLDPIVPLIAQAYIRTRVEALKEAIDEGEVADFFEDAVLQDHLHQLPTIGRRKYKEFVEFIVAELNPILNEYQGAIQYLQGVQGKPLGEEVRLRMQILEGQLAWWSHVISETVSGYSVSRDDSPLDAELLWRVFHICRMSHDRLSLHQAVPVSETTKFLDLALVGLFQKFFENYLLLAKTPEMFKILSQHLGEVTRNSFLNLILEKLIVNMKVWPTEVAMMDACLTLMMKMASEVTSKRLLPNLEAAKAIAELGTSFEFLQDKKLSKLRSKFFFFWGVMIFSYEYMPSFKNFMEPFDRTMEVIIHRISMNELANLDLHHAIVSLFRDLCGIVKSVSKASSDMAYECFFEWFSIRGFDLTRAVIEGFYSAPEVMVPVMRFLSEFVHNIEGRISFSSNSPNGIVLFRQVTQLLQVLSERYKSLPGNIQNMYQSKLKGILLSILVLDRLFSGDYIYFGAFMLYEDNSLAQAINSVMTMIHSVSFEDILSHQKVRRAYFHLLESVIRNYPVVLAELSFEMVQLILATIYDGIGCWDVDTAKMAAEGLNQLLMYVIGRTLRPFAKPTKQDQILVSYVQSTETFFIKVLGRIFKTMLYDKEDSLRFMSSIVLTLLLGYKQVFINFKSILVSAQPTAAQEQLAMMLDSLILEANQESNPMAQETRNKYQSRLWGMRKDLAPLMINSPE
jgi:exportin-7